MRLIAAAAQQGKDYKVAMLMPADGFGVQGLRQALHDLDYTEGRNLVIETRYHEGTPVDYRRSQLIWSS
jgi:hypothetical protein